VTYFICHHVNHHHFLPVGRHWTRGWVGPIIIIIIILIITCMQGISNYIRETNHVSRVYSVAAVLYLQSVLHIMLFRP